MLACIAWVVFLNLFRLYVIYGRNLIRVKYEFVNKGFMAFLCHKFCSLLSDTNFF
jgi:hypothetical protein